MKPLGRQSKCWFLINPQKEGCMCPVCSYWRRKENKKYIKGSNRMKQRILNKYLIQEGLLSND